MAKKIRFPLKLAEGKEVRTLDELREHFDLEKVLEYYKNGKLLTWLEDRYLEGEAEAVRGLDEAKPDFQRQLCAVFQVEYTGDDVDLEEIGRRQEKLKRLRSITDNEGFIRNIDRVAFDQEDLADLLDEGQKQIYLCGEKFQMDGYGETFVDLIIDKFGVVAARNRDDEDNEIVMVTSIADLFDLTKKQFKKVGVTTKDAREFQDVLRTAVAETADYVILGALGIPDLGTARAKQLLKFYGSWEEFMDNLEGFTVGDYNRALGSVIGHTVSYYMTISDDTSSIVKHNLYTVTKYMKNFTESFESLLKVGHTDGDLSPRVKKLCKEQQFEIVEDNFFDILITSSMNSESEKMKLARKKNLPIYTEETFRIQYDPEYEPEEDDSDGDADDD